MRKLLLLLSVFLSLSFYGKAQTCTGPLTVTVSGSTTNEILSASESHNDPSCNNASGDADGNILIAAEGGSPPYTFDWADIIGTDDGAERLGLGAGEYSVIVSDVNGCSFEIGPIMLEEPTPVAVEETLTHLSCHSTSGAADGAIAITASGGTEGAGYSFLWTTTNGSGLVATDEDQTALSAGDYMVVVTDDKGCTVEATYTLTEPTAVTVDETLTHLSCHSTSGNADGAIAITASGGTEGAGYSFLWTTTNGSGLVATDEDQTALTAGDYTVAVTDDNGCTVEATYTLTEPTAVAVDETLTHLSCHSTSGTADGAIAITASGGTEGAGYTYFWTTTNGSGLVASDQDQTDLSAGDYTVVVTDDKGCTVEATYTLTEPAAVTVTEELTHLSCNSGSGSADGAIVITSGGGTVMGDYSYLWSSTNGTGLVPTDQDQTELTAGDYTVVVTDDNGCTVEATYTLTEPSVVVCTASSPIVGMGNTNILCAGGTGTIEVSATGGSGMGYSFSINGVDFQTENIFSDVSAGDYTITTMDAAGCTSTCDVTLTEPAALAAGSCAYIQDVCQLGDGEIKIEASGGIAPYQVGWSASPVAPNTSAGGLDQSSPQAIGASGGSVTFTGATGNNQYSFIVTDANGCETP